MDSISSIIMAVIFFGVIIIFFLWCIHQTIKDRQKRWDAIDPKKSLRRVYTGSCYTSKRGQFFVRVSEWQWIFVTWDKDEKKLIVERPPDIWEHRQKNPIYVLEHNMKIVRERQPVKVKLENYMKRQVM